MDQLRKILFAYAGSIAIITYTTTYFSRKKTLVCI